MGCARAHVIGLRGVGGIVEKIDDTDLVVGRGKLEMADQRHRPTQLELEYLRGMEEDAAGGGDVDESNWSGENNSGPLWDSFEGCAQSIALLYRNPTWQTFQTSAAATTQLYKGTVCEVF